MSSQRTSPSARSSAKRVSDSAAQQAMLEYGGLLKEAHIRGVTEVKRGKRKAKAVLAVFAKRPRNSLPKNLEVSQRGGVVKVPLVVKVAPPMKAE